MKRMSLLCTAKYFLFLIIILIKRLEEEELGLGEIFENFLTRSVASYLLWSEMVNDTVSALFLFALKRSSTENGVRVPSQKRFISMQFPHSDTWNISRK